MRSFREEGAAAPPPPADKLDSVASGKPSCPKSRRGHPPGRGEGIAWVEDAGPPRGPAAPQRRDSRAQPEQMGRSRQHMIWDCLLRAATCRQTLLRVGQLRRHQPGAAPRETAVRGGVRDWRRGEWVRCSESHRQARARRGRKMVRPPESRTARGQPQDLGPQSRLFPRIIRAQGRTCRFRWSVLCYGKGPGHSFARAIRPVHDCVLILLNRLRYLEAFILGIVLVDQHHGL